MVYIWFRFEWQFALGAIVATLHDLLLTIGLFVFHRSRIRHHQYRSDPDHRRLLANDTVVVYDRMA